MHRLLRILLPLVSSISLAPVHGQDPQIDPEAVRKALADFQRRPRPGAVDFVWPHLDSTDASIRQAARLALEAQPFAVWKERAIEEKSTWASLEALRALIGACPPASAAALSPHLCEQITTLRIEQMDEAQLLAALQLTRLVFTQLGPLSADERSQMLDLWSHLDAPGFPRAKAECARLTAFLETAPTR